MVHSCHLSTYSTSLELSPRSRMVCQPRSTIWSRAIVIKKLESPCSSQLRLGLTKLLHQPSRLGDTRDPIVVQSPLVSSTQEAKAGTLLAAVTLPPRLLTVCCWLFDISLNVRPLICFGRGEQWYKYRTRIRCKGQDFFDTSPPKCSVK